MKNLITKKLVAIMIIMVTVTLSVKAQLPSMEGSPNFTPTLDANGYAILSPFNGVLQTWNYNNSYSTRLTKIADIGFFEGGTRNIGMKVYFYNRILINTTAAPTGTIRVKTDPYPGGGNLVLSTDNTNATVFKRFSWPTKNGAQYDTFKYTDNGWHPAIVNGNTNYVYKDWLFMIDSASPTQLDVNGRFVYKISVPLELVQYPIGSSPYRGIYYTDGVTSSNLGMTYPLVEVAPPKRVSAYFASEVSNPGYIVGIDSLGTVFNAQYFPTNFYDSANCDKLSVEAVEKSTGIIAATETWSPYWDIVDEVGTGQSRSDKCGHWTYFRNLKDTTAYQLRFKVNGILAFTQEIITRAKAPKPAGIKPVFTDLIIKSKTTNTVTVNLSFTRGNVDTFPIVLQLRDSSGGSPLLDTTVSVFGTGSASFDITKTSLLASRGYFMQVLQNGVILKTIGFRTLDIVSVETDPVLVSIDVIDIDSEKATAVITVTTGNKAGSAAVENIVILGGGTTYTGTVPIEATATPQTVVKTVPLTGLKSEQDYTCSATLSGKTLTKTFKTSVSTSSISGTSVTGVSAYIDGSGKLQTTGLPTRVIKQVYSLSGNQIGTFNESFDMNIYPSGIYLINLNCKKIKIIKE